MKYVITIEDTERGITMNTQYALNGVQDHAADSLATHVLAALSVYLEKLEGIGAIRMDDMSGVMQ